MSIIFNICAVIIVVLGFYIGCRILSDTPTEPKFRVIKSTWYGDILVTNGDDENDEDEYEINPIRGDSDNEYSDDSETSDTEDASFWTKDDN